MTLEQLRQIFPADEYPKGVALRWLCCTIAMQRKAKVWEFTEWNEKRMDQFLSEKTPQYYAQTPSLRGIERRRFYMEVTGRHEEYDAWLIKQYEPPMELYALTI